MNGTSPAIGLISDGAATIHAIVGPDNGYLVATTKWATNIAYTDTAFYCQNIIFDGGNIANYAFVDMSWSSQLWNCHARNAVNYGWYETGLTRNGTQLGSPRENIQFFNSSAESNGADGLHADSANTATYAPTDIQIMGGYWHGNSGFQLWAGQTAGWQISKIHTYSPNGNDLYLASWGYNSGLQGSQIEGLTIIDSLASNFSATLGPGNAFGSPVASNFKDNGSGETLRSFGNTFYACTAGLSNGYNGPGHIIYTDSDNYNCPHFQWNGSQTSTGQIVAKNALAYYSGTKSQNGPCEINGLISPEQNAGNFACTDFDVSKTLAAGATSVSFTITITLQNISSNPGGGFDLRGVFAATSYYAGPTLETYQAEIAASGAHAATTTNLVNATGLFNALDSAGAPTISPTFSCANTTVSSSGNNVITCTVTATMNAALEATNSRARLRLHSDNRQVVEMTVN
jgi:hypothetical protein